MKTVSIETAKKLKAAGLACEPKKGDWFSWRETTLIYDSYVCRVTVETEDCTWLPTLGDLLERLEERGYYWELYCLTNGVKITSYGLSLMVKGEEWDEGHFAHEGRDATPVGAAAQAVLWVLEDRKASLIAKKEGLK